jgi:predicted O-methyltransferase YrrM
VSPMPADVRRVREEVVRSGRCIARLDGSVHEVFPVAIGEAEGEALKRWVVRERARETIEVGLGYGISSLFICEGLLENDEAAARHVAIDPYQEARFSDCGLQLIEDAGLRGVVEHVAEESLTALPRLLEEGRSFDLAFVDGNHRFDGVFVDLVYLGRLIRPGGVVVLDDYQLPAVARAASFFVANLDWRPEEVSEPHEFHQWAVLRTSDRPDRRAFDDYVEF